jgi:hypothetical protein
MKKIMNKHITNSSMANLYVLTYNNFAFSESNMANNLHLTLEQYKNILNKCGAIVLKDGYYFKNEDDAVKAVIILKLIV